MHRKLAAIVLLAVLSVASTAVAAVCEAQCAAVGINNSDHHQQTASRAFSPHQHMHAQQHRADCPECSKTSMQPWLQLPDCGSLARVQALQENSRVFFDDRAVSPLDVAEPSTAAWLAPIESERFSSLHSPPNISGFQPVLVSIRI